MSIVVGAVIGAGIFLVAGNIAQQLHSIAAVIGVWILGGVLSLSGALILAELGAALPAAGGPYVFLEKAYGEAVAFIYGWASMTLINAGATAALATAIGFYTAPLLGLDAFGQKLLIVLTIAFFTLVNSLGLSYGKRVQNGLTVLKVLGIVLMVAVLYIKGSTAQIGDNMFLPQHGGFHLATFGVALAAVLWAYNGWAEVAYTAGEVRDPGRTLPRSLFLGVVLIIVIYLLVNVAYYAVLTPEAIRGTNRVAAVAVHSVLGQQGDLFISILIIVSVLGTINGIIMTASRVPLAMAQDGLFFRLFARVTRKSHSPVAAIVVQGAAAILFSLVGTFQELYTSFVFTDWIFYGLLAAAVVVLRKRQPDLERPFRCPLYPLTPILFILASMGFVITEFVASFWTATTGVGLLLTGIPLYFLFRYLERDRRAEVFPSNP